MRFMALRSQLVVSCVIIARQLTLSVNYFEGGIPDALSNLSNLE